MGGYVGGDMKLWVWVEGGGMSRGVWAFGKGVRGEVIVGEVCGKRVCRRGEVVEWVRDGVGVFHYGNRGGRIELSLDGIYEVLRGGFGSVGGRKIVSKVDLDRVLNELGVSDVGLFLEYFRWSLEARRLGEVGEGWVGGYKDLWDMGMN